MKVCGECKKYYTIVEENSVEVTECSFKECEVGHPIFRSELPEELGTMTDQLKETTGTEWGWIYLFPYTGVFYWL